MTAHELHSFVKKLVYICGPFRYGGLLNFDDKILYKDNLLFPDLNYLLILQHYTELPDIKRVIVNTHAIEPQVRYWNSYTKLGQMWMW